MLVIPTLNDTCDDDILLRVVVSIRSLLQCLYDSFVCIEKAIANGEEVIHNICRIRVIRANLCIVMR